MGTTSSTSSGRPAGIGGRGSARASVASASWSRTPFPALWAIDEDRTRPWRLSRKRIVATPCSRRPRATAGKRLNRSSRARTRPSQLSLAFPGTPETGVATAGSTAGIGGAGAGAGGGVGGKTAGRAKSRLTMVGMIGGTTGLIDAGFDGIRAGSGRDSFSRISAGGRASGRSVTTSGRAGGGVTISGER